MSSPKTAASTTSTPPISRKTATIWKLLSRRIVNADGTPGKNFAKGQQFQATSSNGVFALSPLTKTPYATMPTPTLNSAQALGIGLELDAELASDHVVFVNPNGTPGPAFPNGDPHLPLKVNSR